MLMYNKIRLKAKNIKIKKKYLDMRFNFLIS